MKMFYIKKFKHILLSSVLCYQKFRIGADLQGNCFPSKSTFYWPQLKLIPKIKECVAENFERFAKESFEHNDANISINWRDNSCRDAKYCTLVMMGCRSNVVNMLTTNKKDANLLKTWWNQLWLNKILIKLLGNGDLIVAIYIYIKDLDLSPTFCPLQKFQYMSRNFPKLVDKLEYNYLFQK